MELYLDTSDVVAVKALSRIFPLLLILDDDRFHLKGNAKRK